MTLEADKTGGRGQLSFEELILTTVVRVLTELFGETGASFISNYLRRHGLEIERVPSDMGKFQEKMTEMLGSGGLALLERIVKELAAEVGVEAPRGSDLKFEEKLNIIGMSYSGIKTLNCS